MFMYDSYDDFRAAWLGQETHRIIGDGDNIIPTIHVSHSGPRR